MRYVAIEKAKDNMVLAMPIYDSINRVLLATGTIMTRDYIRKLKARGLPGFYVEDELAKDIEVQDIVTQELRNEGVEALQRGDLDMIDLRMFDDYTYRHSVNVAVMSTVIALNLGFNKKKLKEVSISAMLHDIGKLMLNPEILNKPGPLTESEYEHIRQHPQIAFDFLRQRMDISSTIRAGILSHHENEDGSGYPNGFVGDDIYIYAKIIHVADVFDALTSKRPYKVPYARSEAVEYLMGGCGRFFDRDVVEAFIQSVAIYPSGTEVMLSDGREGIVAANKWNPLRPLIRLWDGEEIDLNDSCNYRDLTIVPETDAILV